MIVMLIDNQQRDEKSPVNTTAVGVDLAKQTFSMCSVDEHGRVLGRQDFRREAFGLWLAQLPTGTIVAMEACSGAHHWARRCIERGLQPRLMAAQFVTPFGKSRPSKNDRNDAEAIATAARQGNMRFVSVKTIASRLRFQALELFVSEPFAFRPNAPAG